MLGRVEGAACRRPANTPVAAAKPFIKSRRELASVSSGIRLHSMIGPAFAQNTLENLQKAGLILEFQIDFEPGEI